MGGFLLYGQVSGFLGLLLSTTILLRRKTCALLRAKTSALLRRKTCPVLRARKDMRFVQSQYKGGGRSPKVGDSLSVYP